MWRGPPTAARSPRAGKTALCVRGAPQGEARCFGAWWRTRSVRRAWPTRHVASGGLDSTIKIFDAEAGPCFAVMKDGQEAFGIHTPGCLPTPSTLNPQPSTPNPPTLNPKPQILNPRPSTLNPKPSTLSPQSSTLNPRPSTLYPTPKTLKQVPLSSAVDAVGARLVGGQQTDARVAPYTAGRERERVQGYLAH